jgi:hypothetical protein
LVSFGIARSFQGMRKAPRILIKGSDVKLFTVHTLLLTGLLYGWFDD